VRSGPTAVSPEFLDRRQPYWNGIQLDEVSFPSCSRGAFTGTTPSKDFDPYPMVLWRRVF